MQLPIFLLYLDDVHLADALFLQGLAREIRESGTSGQRLVIVHGSGEQAERHLEGRGIFRERDHGVVRVASQEEARLIDQILRDTNRKLASFLTEQVVPAVSIQGDHRRLLQVSDAGAVSTGPIRWLEEIIEKGTIPVISSMATHADHGQTREIAAHEALLALGNAFGSEKVEVVFFLRRNQPALTRKGDRRPEITLADLPGEEVLPAPEQVYRVISGGLSGWLTNPAELCAPEGPRGTRITA